MLRACAMAFLLLLGLAGGPAAAASTATRQALVLYSLGADAASVWQNLLRKGMYDELAQQGWSNGTGLFEERLDALRVGNAAANAAMAPYLKTKYANTRLDVVIAENFTAGRFLSEHPELFPGVPRYYVNHGRRNWQPSDGIGMEVPTDFGRALGIIAQVMPQVQRIVVIGDRSRRVQEWMDGVRAQIPAYRGRIAFDIWDDFSFAELYQRASRLGPRTAIFMLPTYRDNTGTEGAPAVVGRTLADSSKVPVFTSIESLIVGGVAGGYVLSGDQMGRVIARILMQRPADMSRVQGYVFDDVAVRRFKLDNLPPEALLMNRPHGMWDLYRWQIMSSLTLMVLQAVLISALVLALRGRRQSLQALSDERHNLEERVVHRTLELLVANTKLEQLATTDPLTGIGNRRRMTEQIGLEIARARRLRHPLALLMVDIDHFKRINDTHGHELGDRAIVAVAHKLGEEMRSIDMVSRFGGEEFVVLMPETDLETAHGVAERLRAAIASLVLHSDDGQAVPLTISIGVAASVPPPAAAQASLGLGLDAGPGPAINEAGGHGASPPDTASSLLVRADKALYRAKQAGRNRVVSD